MRKFSHFQQNEPFLELVLQRLRFNKAAKYIPKNCQLLDLGCGYHGNFLKFMSMQIKNGVGYDVFVSPQKISANIILKKTNINKWVYIKSSRFDCITALAVLEHLRKPEKMLRNAHHALRKGGTFILTTPLPKSKAVLELLSFRLGVISHDEIKDHKKYYDKKEVKDLLIREGFKIVRIQPFGLGFNILVVAISV